MQRCDLATPHAAGSRDRLWRWAVPLHVSPPQPAPLPPPSTSCAHALPPPPIPSHPPSRPPPPACRAPPSSGCTPPPGSRAAWRCPCCPCGPLPAGPPAARPGAGPWSAAPARPPGPPAAHSRAQPVTGCFTHGSCRRVASHAARCTAPERSPRQLAQPPAGHWLAPRPLRRRGCGFGVMRGGVAGQLRAVSHLVTAILLHGVVRLLGTGALVQRPAQTRPLHEAADAGSRLSCTAGRAGTPLAQHAAASSRPAPQAVAAPCARPACLPTVRWPHRVACGGPPPPPARARAPALTSTPACPLRSCGSGRRPCACPHPAHLPAPGRRCPGPHTPPSPWPGWSACACRPPPRCCSGGAGSPRPACPGWTAGAAGAGLPGATWLLLLLPPLPAPCGRARPRAASPGGRWRGRRPPALPLLRQDPAAACWPGRARALQGRAGRGGAAGVRAGRAGARGQAARIAQHAQQTAPGGAIMSA